MSAVAGTLSAAIIAGLIVVFMKIYDKYHQQSIREYKDMLDIQKSIPESDLEAQEKIKGIVANKASTFFETQVLKDIENSKGIWLKETLYYARVLGLLSAFSLIALIIISPILFLTNLIDDITPFILPWVPSALSISLGCWIILALAEYAFKQEIPPKEGTLNGK